MSAEGRVEHQKLGPHLVEFLVFNSITHAEKKVGATERANTELHIYKYNSIFGHCPIFFRYMEGIGITLLVALFLMNYFRIRPD